MKHKTGARRRPLRQARRLPPARRPAQALAFCPFTELLFKAHSGLCQLFQGALLSSRGLNILFSFAFLTTRCLPPARHTLSDEGKSGFCSLCARAGALPRRSSRFSCTQTSRHPTSLLFRSAEEAEGLKLWLGDLPRSGSICFYLTGGPLLLPSNQVLSCSKVQECPRVCCHQTHPKSPDLWPPATLVHPRS